DSDYAEFLATYDPNKDDLSEVTSKETTESQKREVKTSVFEQDSNFQEYAPFEFYRCATIKVPVNVIFAVWVESYVCIPKW
ncbi:hypothetical protein L195_g047042, partial [Trifolium pratense]